MQSVCEPTWRSASCLLLSASTTPYVKAWLPEDAVPDRRKHRGPGPQDRDWFGGDARPALKAAVSDLSWLLSRGYAGPSALKLVGDRYRLVERQRAAVA